MTEDAAPYATAPKPYVTVIGTAGQNIWQGQGLPKAAIVAHIMQGSLTACDSWFSNPQARASANYGVGSDGTIHQYVDPEGPDAPFANGLIQNPDASVQRLRALHPENPNLWTVSIEHEGMSGDPMPGAQLEASAALAAWLIDRFNIPNDEDHLLGHYEFDSVTRAGCPGWNRTTWLAWEAAINRHLALHAAPEPAQPALAPEALPTLDQLQAQLVAVTADRDRLARVVAEVRALL